MTKKELLAIYKKIDAAHNRLIEVEDVIGKELLDLERLIHQMPEPPKKITK